MRYKIISLRQFYSSPLGHKVKQRLRALTLKRWPKLEGECVVGVGYAPPLLRVLERAGVPPPVTIALMTLEQGAIYWPVQADNRSVLADELRPPFAPGTLHRVVMLHAFEHLAKPEELLKIFWELMVPGGRMLLIVPNRKGWWVRQGNTPFAHGIPYSMTQLCQLLGEAKFTLRSTSTALFSLPSSRAFWLQAWGVVEFIGSWICPGMGGVLVVEVEKQIYAGVGERAAESRKAKQWSSQGAQIAAPFDNASL